MSNPTVSFRISNYHLARALRAIRTIDPAWQLTTPSDLIRTIFNDYIAKSEHLNNTSLEVIPELLQEIALSRAGTSKQTQNKQLDIMPQITKTKQHPQKSAQQIQRELDEDKMFTDMRRESLAKLAKQDKQETELDKELDQQIELSEQTLNRQTSKASKFNDPNITESDISSVTDFSPPTNWKE